MKNNRSDVQQRQQRILKLVREKGEIKVDDIVRMFGISSMTVRRDLRVLEDRKLLIRSHGGALSADSARTADAKKEAHRIEICREAISAYAAGLLNTGDTLFINGSRTALNAVRYVGDKSIRVITNNGWVLDEELPAGVTVRVIGGDMHGHIMVGEYVVKNLLGMRADKTLIGCSAVYEDGEFQYDIPTEIGINEAMISRTEGDLIILADHSKLQRRKNRINAYGGCTYNRPSKLITDELADPEIVRSLENCGIDVVLAPVDM